MRLETNPKSEPGMHATPNTSSPSLTANEPGLAASAPGLAASDIVMEGFILLSMALATLAIGTALYLQFNLSFAGALVCALSLYLGLLATHALVHRNSALAALKEELVDLERQFARATGRGAKTTPAPQASSIPPIAPADTPPTHARAPALQKTPVPMPDAPSGPPTNPGLQNPVASAPNVASAPEDMLLPIDAAALKPGSLPGPPQLGDSTQKAPPPALTSTIADTGITGINAPVPPLESAPTPDFDTPDPAWDSKRWDAIAPPPVDLVTDASVYTRQGTRFTKPGKKKSKKDQIAGRERELPPARPPRESDVEMIQGLIKKLADEVNSANGTPAPAQSVSVPETPKTTGPVTIASQVIATQVIAAQDVAVQAPASTEIPAPNSPEETDAAPQDHQGDAIEASVDALRTTADAMRQHEDQLDDASQHPSTDAGTFAIISQALSTGRVDVLLDPVLGLDNRRARHFEISLRLRDIDNSVIDTHVHAQNLAGTGLSTLLDRATLSRTATVAVQLDSRGRQGAVFSKVTGQSLAVDEFVSDIHSALDAHANLPGQLVMTLTQAHVRAMGKTEWTTLKDLQDLGFKFALASVTDLDMDFQDLGAKGFTFVKLDADVFLNGLQAGETRIPSSDICNHLDASGHTLIVERIDDDTVLEKVAGFGVQFGQGQLFGGPRTVKAQALAPKSGTAAA